MSLLSTLDLINQFGDRNGDRCGCCGKFTVFTITFDDNAKTVVRLCSMCDVEKAAAFT